MSKRNREMSFPTAADNQKYAKPSELNMELMSPNNINRSKQNSPMMNGNPLNALTALRTPQNQSPLNSSGNQVTLGGVQLKKKELQTILNNHDQSYQSL